VDVIGSAPGKVFVIGEYGVVDGGPAVVASINRRLRVRVRARRGSGEITVHGGGAPVRRTLGCEQIADVPPEVRFVMAAALVAARVFALDATDLDITTESELDPGATKTGLGGSAAVTAATVRAVHRIARDREPCGDEEHPQVAAAVYAHRLSQGSGSAADVIASSAGGLVWLDGLDGSDVPTSVADAAARATGQPLDWARLALPSTLALEVVASGRSCATAPRVARYRAAAARSARSVEAWASGMRAASEGFRDGCRAGNAATVLRATRLAARLLSRLGAIASIAVYTPELRLACALADTLPGTAAKPSGAGGGDCAIAITSHRQRAQLRARWSAAGLLPLGVDLEPTGAACEVLP
jgi:phosphomevalonate kinase